MVGTPGRGRVGYVDRTGYHQLVNPTSASKSGGRFHEGPSDVGGAGAGGRGADAAAAACMRGGESGGGGASLAATLVRPVVWLALASTTGP
jgi:hypothetical protein